MGNFLPKMTTGAGAATQPIPVGFVEGASASMRPVEAVIRELALSDAPVLVLAEPGAGKLVTAQRIHRMSGQSAQPFRTYVCSTLKAEDLSNSQTGNVLLAEGTVYLEEVADLSAPCQTRLMYLLSEAEGAKFRARLICGSARDLEVEVKAGRLREDFYYRISGVCLRLPPLRQRREDIPGLLDYFLGKYAHDFHRAKPEVSEETLRRFQEHSWPGNLRELEDAAKVLVVLDDQQVALAGLRAFQGKPNGNGSNPVSLKAASKAASREAEKELILKALTRTQWNRRRAAKELQISYKALLYKLKQIRVEGYGAS